MERHNEIDGWTLDGNDLIIDQESKREVLQLSY